MEDRENVGRAASRERGSQRGWNGTRSIRGTRSRVADGGVEDARVVFLGEDAETPRGMRARRIVRAPEHVLKKAAGLQSVDRVDIVAELATPPLDGIEALGGVASTATRVLALDGIQDPGNLGTLTRTALALGWDAVALLPGTCDPFNDKVRLETKTRDQSPTRHSS